MEETSIRKLEVVERILVAQIHAWGANKLTATDAAVANAFRNIYAVVTEAIEKDKADTESDLS